ncbi:unnamed protein product [Peronospora destructor]|nr:unnamed protein product [Peronospora destructor]
MSLTETLMAVDSNIDHLVCNERSTLLSEAELDYYVENYSASKLHDKVLKPEMARGMDKVMSNLETKLIQDAGHWVLWEQKEEVSAILSEWLAKIAVGVTGVDADAKL